MASQFLATQLYGNCCMQDTRMCYSVARRHFCDCFWLHPLECASVLPCSGGNKNSQGPFCARLRRLERESHLIFLLSRCIVPAPPPSESFEHVMWFSIASRMGGTLPDFALPP
uniref:Ixodegrin n=1 Tax=Rhipicephalus appendiculatus TaxID=34631 RepID=A0A131YJP0_RHIAP